jgi:hypothetical protein
MLIVLSAFSFTMWAELSPVPKSLVLIALFPALQSSPLVANLHNIYDEFPVGKVAGPLEGLSPRRGERA